MEFKRVHGTNVWRAGSEHGSYEVSKQHGSLFGACVTFGDETVLLKDSTSFEAAVKVCEEDAGLFKEKVDAETPVEGEGQKDSEARGGEGKAPDAEAEEVRGSSSRRRSRKKKKK